MPTAEAGVASDELVLHGQDLACATPRSVLPQWPTLTTVAIPTYEMGRTAMRLLVAQIGGAEDAGHQTLPTDLVVRESTAAPPR
jgi:hypothetical protein